MQRDDALQLGCDVAAMFRLAAGEGVLARLMRMRHVVDAGQKRAEHLAVGDDAADRDAAEIDAVIAAFAADQAEAGAVALHPMVGQRHLERRLHRLRSGIGVEDVVHAFRRDIDEAVRKLEGLRVAELEGRGIIELACLLADRLGDLRPAVAGIYAPETGGAVKHLTAVMGRVVHVLGADEQARLLLELPVCRKGHPEGAKIVRCVEAIGHAVLLAVAGPSPGLCAHIFTVRSNYQRFLGRQAMDAIDGAFRPLAYGMPQLSRK